MDFSICSFSFHRLLAAGKQDLPQFMLDCRTLGCTYLDPWNAHFAGLKRGDEAVAPGADPEKAGELSPDEAEYVGLMRILSDRVGLRFGCIAVDGAHIYEADEAKRRANRARAYRWIEVCGRLGARQIRIDAGGPEAMPPEVFKVIQDGYRDLIARAKAVGVEVLTENHWGPTKIPDNVVKLCSEIEGLGHLFDTWNWHEHLREEGWRKCAKIARASHIKVIDWTADGKPAHDVATPIRLLVEAGYKGTWGVESCPKDGDEMTGARRSIALIQSLVTDPDA